MGFRNAYVALVNNARPASDGWSRAALEPHGVSRGEWSRLYSETAKAAGAAAAAYPRWGGTFTLRNAAYIMHEVDVVANWEMSLRDPEQLDPTRIISTVEAAIARARQESEDAKRRERGLTGFIAAFLRWPANLREAAGPGAQRTAAGVIGVFGQILVGITASLLAAGLLAAGIAIWRSIF